MSTPALDLDVATALIDQGDDVLTGALRELAKRGGVDANETLAYDLAHAASALATARSCLAYAAKGEVEAQLVAAFLAIVFSDLATRALGREESWGVEPDWFAPFQ